MFACLDEGSNPSDSTKEKEGPEWTFFYARTFDLSVAQGK